MDWYEIGQTLTIILVGISIMFVAINTMSSNDVQGGLIGSQGTFTDLSNDFNITEKQFKALRAEFEQENITVFTALTIPFTAISTAVSAGILTAKLVFMLLTGWTDVIRLIFEPYGMCCGFTTLGGVAIGILGAIQLYFIFKLVIIVVSVIRGGGGGGG